MEIRHRQHLWEAYHSFDSRGVMNAAQMFRIQNHEKPSQALPLTYLISYVWARAVANGPRVQLWCGDSCNWCSPNLPPRCNNNSNNSSSSSSISNVGLVSADYACKSWPRSVVLVVIASPNAMARRIPNISRPLYTHAWELVLPNLHHLTFRLLPNSRLVFSTTPAFALRFSRLIIIDPILYNVYVILNPWCIF